MDIDVKDPKFLRWAMAILVVAVAVPMYFTSVMYPFTYASGKETVSQLELRHQELSRDLEKARLLVRNLERVEQEYAILHDQWEVAQTLLPEQNQMPDLLRKVSAAGQQSGVEFQIFRPQSILGHGFYADNPIEVSIEGGYHQTGVFLSRLANLNRIVNVSKLRMQGIEKQEDQPYTMKTDLILTAYTLDSSQPAKAAVADVESNNPKAANPKAAKASSKH
ncbi:MAG: type 4a pilus biogenesis protein PilO [bacterium]|nr:type 4a pilus biogenesis protein PilO [bacterium]